MVRTAQNAALDLQHLIEPHRIVDKPCYRGATQDERDLWYNVVAHAMPDSTPVMNLVGPQNILVCCSKYTDRHLMRVHRQLMENLFSVQEPTHNRYAMPPD